MAATGNDPRSSISHPLHIVLYQPEIPPNTGNIGRTCVALGAKLWIVRPASFRLDSAQIKRSGMDYWDDLSWELVDNWEQLMERLPTDRVWLITKFGDQPLHEASYQFGDALVFGRESSGLPDWIHEKYADRQVVIPMPGPVRCLNLATSAGIVMYEAARQIGILKSSAASPVQT
jgi:tRNA (cytidine/uridine-2'-O-)-methyltransferase